MMRKIRIYVDTSVFGGTQDSAFAIESNLFFDQVNQGEYLVLISSLTIDELTNAPQSVKSVLATLPEGSLEEVNVSQEVRELAGKYIEAEVIGPTHFYDAMHIAAATIAGADLILSWSFKHIVNYKRIVGFNSVNMRLGYRVMTILSPLEVVGYEKTDQ